MTRPSAERQLHFNAFLMGCGHTDASSDSYCYRS